MKFSIKQIQGIPFKQQIGSQTRTIIPCYNPALLQRKPEEYPNFLRSVELAVRALHGEDINQTPKETVWAVLDTDEKVEEYITHLCVSKVECLACDIETSGLDFINDYILCIGLSHAKNSAVVIPQDMVESNSVKKLLSLPNVRYVWHNGKFDQGFLNRVGHSVHVDEDTMLLHYALNEVSGTHGLELLSSQLLGAANYKQQLKSNLEEPGDSYAKLPINVLHAYQAQDADYTLQIFHILDKQVSLDARLRWLYQNILIPASNFLHTVEAKGYYTHYEALKKASELLQHQIEDADTRTREEAAVYWDPDRYVIEMEAKSSPEFFNPSSPKQVAWLLYKKLGCKPAIQSKQSRSKMRASAAVEASKAAHIPDTAEATLLSIPNKPAFVTALLELRRLKKLYTTYVVNLLNMRDTDGRIHTTYSLHGTTTGRLASKKPNLQNIPRDKMIKSLFGAPKGRLIMECDYKSAELRALAMYSKDPFLIRIFREGFDMHDETASAMFGADFTSEQRMQAKMINFGIMYGRGPGTIAEACKISFAEAQSSINKWLTRMPLAAAYLQSRREAIRSGCVLTSPFGRKRRFPFVTGATLNTAQNEACNFAIQSVASDFTLLTAIRIQPLLKAYDAFIVNLVHDSIVIELPANKDVADHLFWWVPRQMAETPKQYFDLPFEFLADASIGTKWGDLHSTVINCFAAA